tara:strand:+ start:842 stop:1324 length:483 start_codon:yes stop_codon:yes gene_type:complete
MEPVEQQQQNQPIYWDRHRARINVTLMLAVGFVVLGLFSADQMVTLLGVVVAAYTWLTTPKQYLLFTNALVVVYGRPRTKVVRFEEISHPELLVMPMGQRLRVRLASGKRMWILARLPEEFRDRLDEALRDYNGTPRSENIVEGIVEDIVEEDRDGPPNY